MGLDPPFDLELFDKLVKRFYLALLHGNFARKSESNHVFSQALRETAHNTSNKDIESLFIQREWRGRLCAAWFVGISERLKFVSIIGKLLLASETVYAGEGYAAALALIGNTKCADLLCQYLDIYLPLNGRIFNQDWVVGALSYIDADLARKFLDEALWHEGNYYMNPIEGIGRFSRVIESLHQQRIVDR